MKIKLLTIIIFLNLAHTNDEEKFKFNQSTIQAFYFVIDAKIYGEPLEEGIDWLVAYHNNICIGARKWAGPYTDVPVMGDDGSDYSAGYIQSGQLPKFKIYDASEDILYNATPSEEMPYPKGMVGMIELELLKVDIDRSEIILKEPSINIDDEYQSSNNSIDNKRTLNKKYYLMNIMGSIVIASPITIECDHTIGRNIGNVLQLALPVNAILTTYSMKDWNGFKSFIKSYSITLLATHLLKETTQKQRPDKTDNKSFPSGHTSSAFSGASFVHFQYGFKYSIPLYFLAAYTGYSRIESKRHYAEDVLAGAGLAILNSWYFTIPYSKEYALNLNYIPKNKMIHIDFYKLF